MGSPVWRIEMLGGLIARQGDRSLTHFETRKTAALLACLALHLHRPQPRDVLAEQLWPDEEPETVRSRLRQALSSLRHAFGPIHSADNEGAILLSDRTDIQLNPHLVATDVADFEAAIQAGHRAAEPDARIAHLHHAIGLYRGALLPGYYEDCLLAERERLEGMLHDALGRLARALEKSGDLAGAIEIARRLVAEDPLREDAACELMRLYAGAGRVSDALRHYHDLERALQQELDTAPSAATQALRNRLRAGSAPALFTGLRTDYRDSIPLEAEGGAVPLGSRFYLTRTIDAEFSEAITRRDSIVLVQGPQQSGKTSVLARGLQRARAEGDRVVFTDLQKLSTDQLQTPNTLFRSLAGSLIDQLDLEVPLDGLWAPDRGWNANFERFVRRHVLANPNDVVVWGLDEVDRLLRCPYHADVFALFRSWHNERALAPDGPWSRLTLAIGYATETHLFVSDLSRSLFDVGTRLTLEDFTYDEVAEINSRYGAPLRCPAEVRRYWQLVGGNPYLVRRGLHFLAEHYQDIDALERSAGGEEGPFADHLRRLFVPVTRAPELCAALRAVLRNEPCPDEESFFRLHSAGILLGSSAVEARLRCGLYLRYLENRIP